MRISSKSGLPRLRGVVFDMDGTLTTPNLDFSEMYRRAGVPASEDLLAAVAKMPNAKRTAANAVIEEMEAEGRRTLQLEPGAFELADWLCYHKIPCALVTRNTSTSVAHFHKELWAPLNLPLLSPAISRDDAQYPPKPDPAALHAIASELNLDPAEMLMVGDSLSNDVVFGKRGGCATALVDSGRLYMEEEAGKKTEASPDFRVDNLALLPHLLWEHYDLDPDLSCSDHLPTSRKYPPPTVPTGDLLCAAAAAGDVAALQAALLSSTRNAPPSPNANTPLIWAADAGHLSAVTLLLSSHPPSTSNIDARGYLGATAVSRAARKGHPAVLAALLSAGADPDIANDKRQYPLHFAAFKLHPECVDVLLDFEASTYTLDRKGRTPAEDTSDEGIRAKILNARVS